MMGLVSCSVIETEQSNQMPLEVSVNTTERLNFESYDLFQSAITEIANKNGERSEEIIENFTRIPQGFISLKDRIESNSSEGAVNARTEASENDVNSELLSEMVPDMAFSDLLNENLEIQVENTVFKITEFGTFFAQIDDVESMLLAVDNFERSDLEELRNSKNINGRLNLYDDEGSYMLEEGVYLEDTYSEVDLDEDLIYSNPVSSTSNQIYQIDNFCGYCAPSTPTALPKAEYDKFITHSYGSHTVVGKLIEGFVGSNTAFETSFTSKYRLKVKLYSYNYVVYKSIGLNAKMQKKGWTGLWAKHNDSKATKLVLGWDALLFSIPITYIMPINYQQLPSKAISKEILNFSNFSLESSGLSDVTIPFLDRKSNDWNFLEKALTKQVYSSFADLTKLVWEEAEQEFSQSSIDIRKSEIKHYRKIFPDKTKVMLGRVEVSHANSNEISFVIDRSFQISFDLSSNSKKLAEQILQPTFKNGKKTYTIDGASVFGAAIFDGQTKGIRVVKEL
jgi:hypothetical protein